MKKVLCFVSLFLAIYSHAQFTPNNLAVLKISSTTPIPGGSGTGNYFPTSIVEFTREGLPTSTIIDLSGTTGGTRFVVEDRPITHEGQLNLSINKNFLLAAGYKLGPGATQTPAIMRAGEKVIARINGAGVVDTTTRILPTETFLNQSMRGAVSSSGSKYFVHAGTASPSIRTINNGTTTSTILATGSPTAYRSLGFHGGQLYGTLQSSNAMQMIDSSTGTLTNLPLATLPVTPEYTQFVFMNLDPTVDYNGTGFDVLYIGDRNSGVRKFYWNATTSFWTPVGTEGIFNPSLPPYALGGFFGLVGRMEDGKPTLYGIRNEGSNTSTFISTQLVKIVDNSATISTDWALPGNAVGTFLANSGNSEMFRGISFTPNSSDAILPITLSAFTASLVNNTAQLQWIASSEINASRYSIEKSTNGTTFTAIGSVNALNNNQPTTYNFTDVSLAKGANYYRLKMIDKDGSFSYSKVVTINTNTTSTLLGIFPNPAVNSINITYTQAQKNARMNIVSITGTVLSEIKIAEASTQTSLDVSSLPSGSYVIKYFNGDKVVTKSFVK